MCHQTKNCVFRMLITSLHTFKMVRLVTFKCSNLYILTHQNVKQKCGNARHCKHTLDCSATPCRDVHGAIRASGLSYTVTLSYWPVLKGLTTNSWDFWQKSLPEFDKHATFMNKLKIHF